MDPMAKFKEKAERTKLKTALKGGLILSPDAEKARIDAINKMQAHLNLQAEERNDEHLVLMQLLTAEVNKKGVENADIERCQAVAHQLNEARKRKKYSEIRDLYASLGIEELDEGREHMAWGARQVGIDIVPPRPEEPAAAPPVIVLGADEPVLLTSETNMPDSIRSAIERG
mgnify:CR=1 FL=1